MANIFGIAKKGFGMLGRKKVSPTITSIKPTFPKTVGQKNSRDLKQFGRMVKAKTKKMGDDVSLKVNEISQKLKKMKGKQ